MRPPRDSEIAEAKQPLVEFIRSKLEQCDSSAPSMRSPLNHPATPAFETILLKLVLGDSGPARLLPAHCGNWSEGAGGPEPAPLPEVRFGAIESNSGTAGACPEKESLIRVHDLEIDLERRSVRRAGQRIELTSTEFRVLECLARNRGRVVSRAEIKRLMRGHSNTASNIVDVYIRFLRRKIDTRSLPLILTQYGRGYLLRADPPTIEPR